MDDIIDTGYLPSEVARLILGYLERIHCFRTHKTFFMENPFLEECRLLSKRGKNFSTMVSGCHFEDICRQHEGFQKNLGRLLQWSQKLGSTLATELHGIIMEDMGLLGITFSSFTESSSPRRSVNTRGKGFKTKKHFDTIKEKVPTRETGTMTDKELECWCSNQLKRDTTVRCFSDFQMPKIDNPSFVPSTHHQPQTVQTRKLRKKRSPRRLNKVVDEQYAIPMPMSNEAVEVESFVDTIMNKADTIAANISRRLMNGNEVDCAQVDPLQEFLNSLDKQPAEEILDILCEAPNPSRINEKPSERNLQTPPLIYDHDNKEGHSSTINVRNLFDDSKSLQSQSVQLDDRQHNGGFHVIDANSYDNFKQGFVFQHHQTSIAHQSLPVDITQRRAVDDYNRGQDVPHPSKSQQNSSHFHQLQRHVRHDLYHCPELQQPEHHLSSVPESYVDGNQDAPYNVHPELQNDVEQNASHCPTFQGNADSGVSCLHEPQLDESHWPDIRREVEPDVSIFLEPQKKLGHDVFSLQEIDRVDNERYATAQAPELRRLTKVVSSDDSNLHRNAVQHQSPVLQQKVVDVLNYSPPENIFLIKQKTISSSQTVSQPHEQTNGQKLKTPDVSRFCEGQRDEEQSEFRTCLPHRKRRIKLSSNEDVSPYSEPQPQKSIFHPSEDNRTSGTDRISSSDNACSVEVEVSQSTPSPVHQEPLRQKSEHNDIVIQSSAAELPLEQELRSANVTPHHQPLIIDLGADLNHSQPRVDREVHPSQLCDSQEVSEETKSLTRRPRSRPKRYLPIAEVSSPKRRRRSNSKLATNDENSKTPELLPALKKDTWRPKRKQTSIDAKMKVEHKSENVETHVKGKRRTRKSHAEKKEAAYEAKQEVKDSAHSRKKIPIKRQLKFKGSAGSCRNIRQTKTNNELDANTKENRALDQEHKMRNQSVNAPRPCTSIYLSEKQSNRKNPRNPESYRRPRYPAWFQPSPRPVSSRLIQPSPRPISSRLRRRSHRSNDATDNLQLPPSPPTVIPTNIQRTAVSRQRAIDQSNKMNYNENSKDEHEGISAKLEVCSDGSKSRGVKGKTTEVSSKTFNQCDKVIERKKSNTSAFVKECGGRKKSCVSNRKGRNEPCKDKAPDDNQKLNGEKVSEENDKVSVKRGTRQLNKDKADNQIQSDQSDIPLEKGNLINRKELSVFREEIPSPFYQSVNYQSQVKKVDASAAQGNTENEEDSKLIDQNETQRDLANEINAGKRLDLRKEKATPPVRGEQRGTRQRKAKMAIDKNAEKSENFIDCEQKKMRVEADASSHKKQKKKRGEADASSHKKQKKMSEEEDTSTCKKQKKVSEEEDTSTRKKQKRISGDGDISSHEKHRKLNGGELSSHLEHCNGRESKSDIFGDRGIYEVRDDRTEILSPSKDAYVCGEKTGFDENTKESVEEACFHQRMMCEENTMPFNQDDSYGLKTEAVCKIDRNERDENMTDVVSHNDQNDVQEQAINVSIQEGRHESLERKATSCMQTEKSESARQKASLANQNKNDNTCDEEEISFITMELDEGDVENVVKSESNYSYEREEVSKYCETNKDRNLKSSISIQEVKHEPSKGNVKAPRKMLKSEFYGLETKAIIHSEPVPAREEGKFVHRQNEHDKAVILSQIANEALEEKMVASNQRKSEGEIFVSSHREHYKTTEEEDIMSFCHDEHDGVHEEEVIDSDKPEETHDWKADICNVEQLENLDERSKVNESQLQDCRENANTMCYSEKEIIITESADVSRDAENGSVRVENVVVHEDANNLSAWTSTKKDERKTCEQAAKVSIPKKMSKSNEKETDECLIEQDEASGDAESLSCVINENEVIKDKIELVSDSVQSENEGEKTSFSKAHVKFEHNRDRTGVSSHTAQGSVDHNKTNVDTYNHNICRERAMNTSHREKESEVNFPRLHDLTYTGDVKIKDDSSVRNSKSPGTSSQGKSQLQQKKRRRKRKKCSVDLDASSYEDDDIGSIDSEATVAMIDEFEQQLTAVETEDMIRKCRDVDENDAQKCQLFQVNQASKIIEREMILSNPTESPDVDNCENADSVWEWMNRTEEALKTQVHFQSRAQSSRKVFVAATPLRVEEESYEESPRSTDEEPGGLLTPTSARIMAEKGEELVRMLTEGDSSSTCEINVEEQSGGLSQTSKNRQMDVKVSDESSESDFPDIPGPDQWHGADTSSDDSQQSSITSRDNDMTESPDIRTGRADQDEPREKMMKIEFKSKPDVMKTEDSDQMRQEASFKVEVEDGDEKCWREMKQEDADEKGHQRKRPEVVKEEHQMKGHVKKEPQEQTMSPFAMMTQNLQMQRPQNSSTASSNGNPLGKMNIGNFLFSLYQK